MNLFARAEDQNTQITTHMGGETSNSCKQLWGFFGFPTVSIF